MRYLGAASLGCVGHFATLSAIGFTFGMFGIVALPLMLLVLSVLTLGAAFILSLVFTSSRVRYIWTSRSMAAPLCLATGLILFWLGLAMSSRPPEPQEGQDADTTPLGTPGLTTYPGLVVCVFVVAFWPGRRLPFDEAADAA